MDDKTKQELDAAEQELQARKQEETIAHLRARVQQAEGQLKNYQESAGGMEELYQSIATSVQAVEPYPRVKYERIKDPSRPVSLVADLSDLHIGEVVNPAEVEGLNEFNWAIAQDRVFQFAKNLVKWSAVQRRAYPVDELVVLGKGDYISGSIHKELEVTNEFPPPVQAVNAGHLVGEFIAKLAPHFDKVRFVGVGADNHGRLTVKPQAKQKAQNNYSFVTHAVARAELKKHPNVEFIEAQGMKYLADIQGFKFLIEHGDSLKGWAGLPFYGMQRGMGKEALRRMGSDMGFTYWSMGHWHTPCIIEGRILINGSLSGTSEFDHSCGRHADPCQVSYMVHPKYGLFNWVGWKFKKVADAAKE